MTHTRRFALIACLAITPLMVACDGGQTTASQPASQPAGSEPRTALGRTIDEALREAREEIATENISIGGDTDIRVGGASIGNRTSVDADGNPLPKAEISPAGDFLIAGETVDITPAQRELLLDYRGHVVSLIEAGMAIGVKGADLGMHAAGEALKSMFTGEAADFEQRVEAEAAKLEGEAMQLCGLLPAMLQTQQQLAESLAELRPYATMTAEDIEDCHSDAVITEGTDDVARRHEVRDSIRSTIRQSIRGAAQATGLAEGGTPPDAVEPAADEATTQ